MAKGKHIREHLKDGKGKAIVLSDRLDNLLHDTIPELERIIKDKFKMIEEVDGLYDVLLAKIDD